MAGLAQTTLDIDTITVTTIYNRNSYLSSGEAYVPVVSTSFNETFSKWANANVNHMYDSVFYTYSNGGPFTSSLSSIQNAADQSLVTLSSMSQFVSTYTSSQYATLKSLSNFGPSTITGLSTTYARQSTNVYRLGSTTNKYYSSIVPALSTTIITPANFFQRMYSPTVSTLIEQAIYDYIPRSRIGEFTASPGNPNPLLGGIFGDNTPLPWYWADYPPRYVGPGISSLSTIFSQATFYNDVTYNFNNTLQNISTGFSYSNSSLAIYRQNIRNTVINANLNIDTGSSISTAFFYLNSTFTNKLSYASTFGPSVSTISSSITPEISTATTAPTLNGYSIADYISTYSTLFTLNQAFASNKFLSTMVSVDALANYLSTFSTTVGIFTSTMLASTILLNQSADFSNISTSAQNISDTIYASTTVSTNYKGYIGLSTLLQSTLSTFYKSSTFNNPYTTISSYTSTILYGLSTAQNTKFPVVGFTPNFNTTKPSTVFKSVYVNSIVLSSISVSSLGVNTMNPVNQTASLLGGLSIEPTNPISPFIDLPNLQLFYTAQTMTTPANMIFNRIISYNSTIIFNSTNIVIHNSSGQGQIGINREFPTYSLDIGSGGDARKPSGSKWVNPSDTRIKESVSTLDFMTAMGKISSLRLVNYRWADEYRQVHQLPSDPTLGFISQEVEAVFPNSIKQVKEGDIGDFRILDTSQITFCKYAATQGLLQKVSTLQSRVNTLLKEY